MKIKHSPDLKLNDSIVPVFPVNHCKQLSGAKIFNIKLFKFDVNISFEIRLRKLI